MRKMISLVLVLALVFVIPGLAPAATITVGSGAGYDVETIQAGIDAAVDRDTVLVASGEYVVTEPITFRGKAITVVSEAGSDETTIRMGTPADNERGTVVVFENSETAASVLEGFTITGGRGSWVPSEQEWWGGGVYFDASSGTVRGCTIVQNRTEHGGGILCVHPCTPNLTDCVISENSASRGVGGGVCGTTDTSVKMTSCIIRDNSATVAGGGIWCDTNSSVTMNNCIIRNNYSGESHGGVACYGDSSLTMSNCTIIGNTAQRDAGGVYVGFGHSSGTVAGCIIARNTAQLWGGGGAMCSWPGSSLTISNCTITDNSGGSRWGGGGVLCRQGSMTVTNSIIWGNEAPMGREISVQNAASTLTIAYSNVAGGQAGASVESRFALDWGVGNIDTDPLFARLGYLDDRGTRSASDDVWVEGDYHLKSRAGRWDPNSQTWVQDDVTSPCIDAGDPNTPSAFEAYPNGAIINMGAYGGTPEASKSPSGLHSRYGGGTGEPSDPHLIYTAEHLNALGAEPNDYDKHFKLMADIDLSGHAYEKAVIAPDTNKALSSGFDGISFTGSFDGNNQTISRLTITGGGYLGLFGRTDSVARISNLGLEAADVRGTGGNNVGGLIGYNNGGSITSSYSTGWVSGYDDVGGLVGWNEGSITSSYSTASVSGGADVGGLVGENGVWLGSGSITNSRSTGTVNGNRSVGGLVGSNAVTITMSYSTGTVNGNRMVGGLVGSNWGWSGRGSITSSYSTGTVSGDSEVGGLVGVNPGSIAMSYSSGMVSGTSSVGGLVGDNTGTDLPGIGAETGCFWDIRTSGQAASAGGEGKTTPEMQTALTFLEAGWDFIDETDNGMEDIWWIVEGQDYPRLWWELIPQN